MSSGEVCTFQAAQPLRQPQQEAFLLPEGTLPHPIISWVPTQMSQPNRAQTPTDLREVAKWLQRFAVVEDGV